MLPWDLRSVADSLLLICGGRHQPGRLDCLRPELRGQAPETRFRASRAASGSIPGTTEGELLAARRELLRRGLPRAVARELDDEHGFIPIGVDVNGDVAATAFIRRLLRGAPAGRSGLETSEFQRRDSTWAYLGGGAGHFEEYPLV